ncbi:hypothetical protein ALP32_200414 [Pseudomonas avellanae]|uniref:Uncharacterized protein n=1 Tax=Pseudomonas avellanae TaxID=46257 RepID=A0A3M5UA50_9PSED|nr:hypothetical protein ALP32_200414 [Pseudomonas avellanae]
MLRLLSGEVYVTHSAAENRVVQFALRRLNSVDHALITICHNLRQKIFQRAEVMSRRGVGNIRTPGAFP